MYGYRLVDSKLIWEADTPVSWPTFNANLHVVLTEDGDLVSQSSNSIPEMWLEIDNTPGPSGISADFCLIEFAGEYASITPDPSIPGTAKSTMRAACLGLPVVGEEVELLDGFGTHPVKEATMSLTKLGAMMNDSLAVTSTKPNSFPPFFGYVPDAGFAVDVSSGGWPMSTQSTASGDKFHLMFSIGKIGNPATSISGYRKLYFALKSVNPGTSTTTAMTISGRMYAHLYEYRGDRR